jgi:hypothetical protein
MRTWIRRGDHPTRIEGSSVSRRRLLMVVMGILIVVAALGSRTSAGRSLVSSLPGKFMGTPPTPVWQLPSPWFGLLQTSGDHNGEERGAGINVATLSLAWSRYEPQRGQFDTAYIAAERARLNSFLRDGLHVTLDAGLQYPPPWVFTLDPNTRYIDQYGDVWHGKVSEEVPDAVHDPNVRQAEAQYVARIAADMGDRFFAIRAGGLLGSELRYPPTNYLGHSNCYWAFNQWAQQQSSVPGWRPGGAGTTEAGHFLDEYLSAITAYQNWVLRTFREKFSGWLQVLYPSFGLRPGDIPTAVASNLDGSTEAASHGTLSMGLDWERQVATIPVGRVIVYTTWLDMQDTGDGPTRWSPVRYLLSLAQPRGLSVAGENTGDNSAADVARVVALVRSLHLDGMMWMNETQLSQPGDATLADYAAAISGHAGGR